MSVVGLAIANLICIVAMASRIYGERLFNDGAFKYILRIIIMGTIVAAMTFAQTMN